MDVEQGTTGMKTPALPAQTHHSRRTVEVELEARPNSNPRKA